MTEPLVFAGLAGLLYFTVCFGQTRSWAVLGSGGLFANAAALSRYEGWFVLPFVAVYVLLAGGRAPLDCLSWRSAAMAALRPPAWLAHNLWYYGNPLEFYNGPYSAQAIYQRALDAGLARYPGDHDWPQGAPLLPDGCAAVRGMGPGRHRTARGGRGAGSEEPGGRCSSSCCRRRFYVMSLYSAGTPIFVPDLVAVELLQHPLRIWPRCRCSPLAAPRWWRRCPHASTRLVATAAIAIAIVPWFAYPRLETWCAGRRAPSTPRRAAPGRPRRPTCCGETTGRESGLFTSFGDQIGVFREAGIPLREVLHNGNGPAWYGAAARPDLFLHEEWGLAIAGDPVESAILQTLKRRPVL